MIFDHDHFEHYYDYSNELQELFVSDIGYDNEIEPKYKNIDNVVDGQNCCVIPGLVDCHSHPVS